MPQRSLIGPALYPIYLFVLKIVALCYLIPWILVWIGILLFHRAGFASHLSSEWHSIGTLWTVVFTQFGIITLIFAAIDRVSVKTPCVSNWDPRKLPKIKAEIPTKRRVNTVAGMVFAVLGLLWVLAIPDYPFLIIGPAAYFLKAATVWHSVYWPIVALAVSAIFEHAFILLRPQLTWFQPTFRVATTLLSAWVVSQLLQTHTYVIAANQSVAGAAAIVNLCILVSAGIWAVSLVVSLLVYGYQAFREIRRSMQSTVPHPA